MRSMIKVDWIEIDIQANAIHVRTATTYATKNTARMNTRQPNSAPAIITSTWKNWPGFIAERIQLQSYS